jgi:lipid-A-disaccharide synthase
MRIFFSAGEPSGDLHAANLLRELRRRGPIDAVGLGSARLREEGCQLLRDMSELAVMGFFPVIAKLPEFFRLLARVKRELDERRPDAVVLIDYPGFNWHVARAAKERGIPVFYYGLPQLWAWASWRVRKVQKYVDHALCKLPFEEAWFRDRGCRATYIGHPYFDELRTQQLDQPFIASFQSPTSRLVTILPGSRTHEVRYNLPLLLKAAAQVRREVRNVRLAVASYNDRQAALARQLVASGPVPAEVFVNRTPELISAAECCLACSGSVSLELLYHTKPSVIVYRVSWLTYQLVRPLINVRHISLVNLLSDQPLFPEFPTWRDCSNEVAHHAIRWLTDDASRDQLTQQLAGLRSKLAASGASSAAANYILRELRPQTTAPYGAGVLPAHPLPLRRAS